MPEVSGARRCRWVGAALAGASIAGAHAQGLELPFDEPAKLAPQCRTTHGPAVPMMPLDVVRSGRGGSVIARASFVALDAEPIVDILFDSGIPSLGQSVRAVMRTYRLSCPEPGMLPVTATQVFQFKLEGQATTALQSEFTLVQLLGAMQGIASEHLRFDFQTMGCPFAVRFAPYRPYAPNGVSEVGARNPNRREFIEWLRGLTLAVSADDMRTLVGQQATVSVPCTVLDLR